MILLPTSEEVERVAKLGGELRLNNATPRTFQALLVEALREAEARGLERAMRAVDAMKTNRPGWHDVHSPIDRALGDAVDAIRALKKVPHG